MILEQNKSNNEKYRWVFSIDKDSWSRVCSYHSRLYSLIGMQSNMMYYYRSPKDED